LSTQETPPTISQITSDEKMWIVLSHLSVFLGVGILLPLIVYLVKKEDSPKIAEHAKEALNFHISLYIYAFIAGLSLLAVVGIILVPIVAAIGVIFPIMAAVKASDSVLYRYPLTIRFI